MKHYILDKNTLEILSTYKGPQRELVESWCRPENVYHIEAPEDSEFVLENGEVVARSSKLVQKEAAKQQMTDDIYAQMIAIFGTKNTETAVADHETFKLMKDQPASFLASNIKDSEGNALDTEQKLIDHATAKLAAIASYAAYRMSRKEQYKQEVETIENS